MSNFVSVYSVYLSLKFFSFNRKMRKILFSGIFCALSAFSFIASGADATLDSDGMPVVYLRGNFNNTNWEPRPEYRFDRSGNTYTLVINSSNAIGQCDFKIADDEWELCNLGAGYTVNSSQYVEAVSSGGNMSTDGLSDCVISFDYVENARTVLVKFIVDGIDIPEAQIPDPVGLSGTLPVLYINVFTNETHTQLDNEIIDKDLSHKNYFENAEYWLDVNGCKWMEKLGAKNVGSKEEPLPLQIKARGNYTRTGFSKKPFKLKLDKKQSLLGLTKSKHFAILAHADDTKGYLRNFIGFNLGKRIGLPWTPAQQPVEVVINGDYRGIYFLTESIRVEEERVNITELKDNVADPRLVSGGYIVELDNYNEDDAHQIRMEEKSCVSGYWLDLLRITFDTPEEYSDIQRWFVENQFTTMNDYVGDNDDRLWRYLDLDDAARYYLVEEIVSHTESYHGSTYLFRDYGDGQKWHFSPLWDFGNAFNGSTDAFFYDCHMFGTTWIPSLRANDKFNEKVKETWLWFMQNEYDGLEKDIDDFVSNVTEAAKADYKRWAGQPIPSGGNSVADNRNMEGKASEVKNHLRSKINWLKNQFGDFNTGTYSEPERDDTPAAELPAQVATHVVEIDIDKAGDNAEFYNLQGIRIANPAPGEIYIVRKGAETRKIIAR